MLRSQECHCINHSILHSATATTKDDERAHVGAIVKVMAVHKMPSSIKGRFIKARISDTDLLTVLYVSEGPELEHSILKVLCSVWPACIC
jgi:hypothetical protein